MVNTTLIISQIRQLEESGKSLHGDLKNEIKKIQDQLKAITKYIGIEDMDTYSAGTNNPTESLKEYVENTYGRVFRQMEERENEKSAFQKRRSISKLWFRKLNERKQAFYNAIRCKGIAEVLQDQMNGQNPFIPPKYLENQDAIENATEEDRKNFAIHQMEVECDRLLHQNVKYVEMYSRIDEQILDTINQISKDGIQYKMKEL